MWGDPGHRFPADWWCTPGAGNVFLARFAIDGPGDLLLKRRYARVGISCLASFIHISDELRWRISDSLSNPARLVRCPVHTLKPINTNKKRGRAGKEYLAVVQ